MISLRAILFWNLGTYLAPMSELGVSNTLILAWEKRRGVRLKVSIEAYEMACRVFKASFGVQTV